MADLPLKKRARGVSANTQNSKRIRSASDSTEHTTAPIEQAEPATAVRLVPAKLVINKEDKIVYITPSLGNFFETILIRGTHILQPMIKRLIGYLLTQQIDAKQFLTDLTIIFRSLPPPDLEENLKSSLSKCNLNPTAPTPASSAVPSAVPAPAAVPAAVPAAKAVPEPTTSAEQQPLRNLYRSLINKKINTKQFFREIYNVFKDMQEADMEHMLYREFSEASASASVSSSVSVSASESEPEQEQDSDCTE